MLSGDEKCLEDLVVSIFLMTGLERIPTNKLIVADFFRERLDRKDLSAGITKIISDVRFLRVSNKDISPPKDIDSAIIHLLMGGYMSEPCPRPNGIQSYDIDTELCTEAFDKFNYKEQLTICRLGGEFRIYTSYQPHS